MATEVQLGAPNLVANLFTATPETGQVLDDCKGYGATYIPGHKGLWFKVVGTGERLTADTCIAGYLTTHISVYKGSCGPTTLQCVTGRHEGTYCATRLLFDSEVGVTYYLLYRSQWANTLEGSNFVVSMASVPTPSNDFLLDCLTPYHWRSRRGWKRLVCHVGCARNSRAQQLYLA
jgi:hypothetical protein